MVQNSCLEGKRLIPDTAESNKHGDDIKGSSNPLETDVKSEKRIASGIEEYVKQSGTNKKSLSLLETEDTSECTGGISPRSKATL